MVEKGRGLALQLDKPQGAEPLRDYPFQLLHISDFLGNDTQTKMQYGKTPRERCECPEQTR